MSKNVPHHLKTFPANNILAAKIAGKIEDQLVLEIIKKDVPLYLKLFKSKAKAIKRVFGYKHHKALEVTASTISLGALSYKDILPQMERDAFSLLSERYPLHLVDALIKAERDAESNRSIQKAH